MGLHSLPAEALTVARYLAARAGGGASMATLRLVTSAIAKAHEWAKQESPCGDPGVRAFLEGCLSRCLASHGGTSLTEMAHPITRRSRHSDSQHPARFLPLRVYKEGAVIAEVD